MPNYYAAAPNTAIALARSTDGGLDHGGNVAPATKHLRLMAAMTATSTVVPFTAIVADYLMFYPFLDMSTTGSQLLTTAISLPRYTYGKLMAVIVAAPSGVGNPRFNVQYTNQDGITGRQTPFVATGTQIVNGTIITTGSPITNGGIPTVGPFLPLQAGDYGVSAVEAINFIDVDVGLITLVIVKPLGQIMIRTIDAVAERDFLREMISLPIIKDDAYLNLICYPGGTLAAAPIHGYIQSVWN